MITSPNFIQIRSVFSRSERNTFGMCRTEGRSGVGHIEVPIRDVREWLSTLPFPSIQFSFPPTPIPKFLTYSHSHGIPVWAIPFPFRVNDRVRVSLGMWNNPKFTRPSIASIRIMWVSICKYQTERLNLYLYPLLFVLLPKARYAQTHTRDRIYYISVVGKLGTIGIGIWQV